MFDEFQPRMTQKRVYAERYRKFVSEEKVRRAMRMSPIDFLQIEAATIASSIFFQNYFQFLKFFFFTFTFRKKQKVEK